MGSECTTFVYWRHCWHGSRLGASIGWNASAIREAKTIAAKAQITPRQDWFHPNKSPGKALNDSPRDFGQSSAQPTKMYVKDLVNAGFLFARKFGKDEHGKL